MTVDECMWHIRKYLAYQMENKSERIGKLLTHAIHSSHPPASRIDICINGKFRRKEVNKTRDEANENVEWIGEIALMATYFLPEA